MKTAFALLFYSIAFALIFMGFSIPASDGLNHHIMPQNNGELAAAALIIFGCIAKLTGHAVLLSTTRAR